MTARAKSGCQSCRARHLKCDHGTPTCGRCLSAGRECIRSYKYRFHHSRFNENQKWVKNPKSLTFIDESHKVAIGGESDSDLASDSDHLRPLSCSPIDHSSSTSKEQSSHAEPLSPTEQLLDAAASLTQIGNFAHEKLAHPSCSQSPGPSQTVPAMLQFTESSSFTGSIFDKDNSRLETPNSEQRELATFSVPRSQIYLERAVWPLTDPSEGLLLRHYVHHLAIWLDLCDPVRHFQVDVPQRAGTCPILLNGIFALSARHLNVVNDYDPLASNRYHQECLKHLIPMLNDAATISDESLFAATIILRVLEEIDAPIIGSDTQGHMLGIQVFINARDPNSRGGSLGDAAFWVGLRQEIYSAVIHHKSIQLNLSHCNVDRSFEPASDFAWANRAVVHCADVLNFCFGDLGVSASHWTELDAQNKRWEDAKPSTFTPTYYKEADRSKRKPFPEVWYEDTCHVIGVQHHILAQILLATYNPNIPRVGGNRKAAVLAMEEDVKSCIRISCGIGLSNRFTPPGIFTASMCIAMCGDLFTDPIDQEAILDLLATTERDHARPTAAVRKQLTKAWGWDPT